MNSYGKSCRKDNNLKTTRKKFHLNEKRLKHLHFS